MSEKEILTKLADKRTKCVVYTRVMGYHRPVESFKERVKFDECASTCQKSA